MILRSPFTTSMRVDRSPIRVSDRKVRKGRTAKGVVGRESACDLEFQLWLCCCLFSNCTRRRAQSVILLHSSYGP